MVELVDTTDLSSVDHWVVRVRVPLRVPTTNFSTHTADDGLSKIQFRTAGSRMLKSVFIANQALLRYGFIPVG